MAESLNHVPILTGYKRVITGRYAIENYGVDTILLDDGFQHLAVKRDIDLVLFNADTLMGNSRVLPGGDLREPATSLTRADGFVITGVNDKNIAQVDAFKQYLDTNFPGKPTFQGEHKPVMLLQRGTREVVDNAVLDEVAKLPLYGFCGIGSPYTFKHTLQQYNFNLVGFNAFGDHFTYSKKDLNQLRGVSVANGAQGLITTQKDFVKLKHNFFSGFPIFSLDIELVLDERFDTFLLNCIQRNRERS